MSLLDESRQVLQPLWLGVMRELGAPTEEAALSSIPLAYTDVVLTLDLDAAIFGHSPRMAILKYLPKASDWLARAYGPSKSDPNLAAAVEVHWRRKNALTAKGWSAPPPEVGEMAAAAAATMPGWKKALAAAAIAAAILLFARD